MILNADGRFKLLSKPMAYPFKNIITNTPDGPVFDLVDVDGYDGVVYITADHVVEMAKILGMKTEDDVQELHDRINKLEAEKDRLPEGVDTLVNGINELVVAYNRGVVLGAVGGSISDIPLPIEFGAGKDESPIRESPVSDGQKSSASKRKGTDELSGNSVDEFGFGN